MWPWLLPHNTHSIWTGFGLIHAHPYADTTARKNNRQKAIQFIQRNGVAPFVKQFFYALFAPDFARTHTDLIEQLTAKAADITAETIIAASQAMINRPDCSEVLQQTTLPVLIVGGYQDDTLPLQLTIAQSLLPKITKLVLLENVGHMGMYESPKVLGDAISLYLAALREEASSF